MDTSSYKKTLKKGTVKTAPERKGKTPFEAKLFLPGGEHKQSRTKPQQEKILSYLVSLIAGLICFWWHSHWLQKIGSAYSCQKWFAFV